MKLETEFIQLLKNRGVETEADIEEFLSNRPRRTYDPFLLLNMEEGVDLILSAVDEGQKICIYGDYTAYGALQKYIEENGYELISGGFERIPNVDLKEVTPEQRSTLEKLTNLLEDDEDVTNVYTTLAPAAE